ncbi:MAG TPA: DUF131 domain-containing protein [Acidobacteriota bacterium]|nr:DUF131 domain-containing protein [Acidobacteriota bacterium]
MRIADEKSQETAEEGTTVSNRLFLFLILGFALVFIGIIVILIATVLYGGGSANVGAVIFIGPFPIVIGAGPDVTWIVLFSIILAVLSVVVFLVMNRRMRRSGG